MTLPPRAAQTLPAAMTKPQPARKIEIAIELLFVAGRIGGNIVKGASPSFEVFSLYGRLIV